MVAASYAAFIMVRIRYTNNVNANVISRIFPSPCSISAYEHMNLYSNTTTLIHYT